MRDMERALELAQKAGFSDFALKLVEVTNCLYTVARDSASSFKSWDDVWFAVYAAKDSKEVVFEHTKPFPSDPSQVVDEAQKRIEVAEPSPLYTPLESSEVYEKQNKLLEIENEIAELSERIHAKLSGKPEYVSYNTLSVWAQNITVKLYTSAGARIHEGYSRCWATYRAFADQDTTLQRCEYTDAPKKLKPEESLRSVWEDLKPALNRLKPERGAKSAILSPQVVGNLINSVGSASSAFSVLIGNSFLKDKNRVASPLFTLLDVGEGFPGMPHYDDEGTKTQSTVIIQRGELKNLLHNRKTAKKFGVKSTGNAGWISPSPWALVIEKGDAEYDELVRSLKDGYIVTNNWYTRFQSFVTGDFSTITRDVTLVVKNGEIVGSTKGLRISENILDLLSRAQAVEKRTHLVKWWEVETPVQAPHIMFEKVNFTLPE
ncbi:hypothetical protein B9Q01_01585 [Candidatus Marsarchaeota G1 archaeon OSP_D]|uniref:Metalloprotease TldD/E C-terminal domain-containing protein n=5 Tax=Candidatus Marsarchaeota TaxID=1978152 RepID=A0A2R6C2X5_9ARCH|nr:MAG: hypothetical protein B9Q01_01585 [Candidatus Marsarchaeota G1 archaeon OSP_D]PSN85849.1 MAG: hypothetical protein B9Q02_04680 [Candidatus Marsarchaeota G1 archaeon BE_D]PSN89370.1 MAG: hypothetical protein B9Q00_01785 [Candidatus Marsarchaeota G1 archaeon OSP_C]PSO05218.1 MAG: hypothetical protein B9Q12_00915 [Candidatus Marsarchaeota G2 archaeon ECH_B_SAG-G06]